MARMPARVDRGRERARTPPGSPGDAMRQARECRAIRPTRRPESVVYSVCISCRQRCGDAERVLAPNEAVKVKWRQFEPGDRVVATTIPRDGECYYCWDTRRLHYKTTRPDGTLQVISQEALLESFRSDARVHNLFLERRRSRIRSVVNRDNTQDWVQEIQTASRQEFEEGMRIRADLFLARHFRGSSLGKMAQLLQVKTWPLHDVTWTNDGCCWLEVLDYPLGVHRFKRLVDRSTTIHARQEFGNDLDGTGEVFNGLDEFRGPWRWGALGPVVASTTE